ncbi:MAG: PilN domain-containing protein [Roseiarcus sp.]
MSSKSSAFWNKQLLDGSLNAAASRFWYWYKAELFSFFSPATVVWLLDRGDRKLVLRAMDGAKELRFADGETGAEPSPIPCDELLDSSVERALARRGVPRYAAKISLQVPREAFFVRRFDIPAAAEASVSNLLIADIERKTPFRASDVVYGHVLIRRRETPDKIGVQLWILRRDIITRAIEGSGISWSDLDNVAPERAFGDQDGGPIIALADRHEGSRWFRNATIGLSALTAALTVTGLAATIWRQNEAMKELDARIVEVSTRATHVRKIADQAVAQSRLLAILREERERSPALADLWEEISRILPDDAFLSEFRLSEVKSGERVLDLIGYAESAVRLPALFDKSPLFSDASLTAAITPDIQSKREAFSLRVKVKQNNVAEMK